MRFTIEDLEHVYAIMRAAYDVRAAGQDDLDDAVLDDFLCALEKMLEDEDAIIGVEVPEDE